MTSTVGATLLLFFTCAVIGAALYIMAKLNASRRMSQLRRRDPLLGIARHDFMQAVSKRAGPRNSFELANETTGDRLFVHVQRTPLLRLMSVYVVCDNETIKWSQEPFEARCITFEVRYKELQVKKTSCGAPFKSWSMAEPSDLTRLAKFVSNWPEIC